MGLTKQHGNMYPWITHMHNHIEGECPHRCSYCYVAGAARQRPEKYSGPLRLNMTELNVDYGSGKTIFVEHMNDIAADTVPMFWIRHILGHCERYPDNHYVVQSKKPSAFLSRDLLPDLTRIRTSCKGLLVGTTIETNRDTSHISETAPSPTMRFFGVQQLAQAGFTVFVTIEPILDFDTEAFVAAIVEAKPSFVNIGADSKGHGLLEPSAAKIKALIAGLQAADIAIREKRNLTRLVPDLVVPAPLPARPTSQLAIT